MSFKNKFPQFSFFLFICLIYLIRIFAWASADLNHDEALTLGMYCHSLDGEYLSFFNIFRNYTLANNHFLSSACYWLWLKVLFFHSNSFLVRFPSLFFAFFTLWVIYAKWGKHIEKFYSFVMALVFASGFIYNSFSYQVRGYSMSMFLSACIVYYILEILKRRAEKGQFMLCFLLFLQPLIMPSAAIIAVASTMIIFIYFYYTEKNVFTALKWSLPGLLCAILSASYYLTLGEQLTIAAENAGKVANDIWNRYSALGNVFQGLLLHCGILLIPLLVILAKKSKKAFDKQELKEKEKQKLLKISLFFFCPVILIIAMYLFAPASKLPFPRNSLVFLPFISFAITLASAETKFLYNQKKLLILLILLINFGAEYYYNQKTLSLIKEGKRPHSLTMQLYRSASDFSKISKTFKKISLKNDTIIFVQDHDLASLLWHMTAEKLPTENLHSPKTIESNIFADFQINKNVIIIAQSEKQAEEFLNLLNLPRERATQQGVFGRRKLYVWQ